MTFICLKIIFLLPTLLVMNITAFLKSVSSVTYNIKDPLSELSSTVVLHCNSFTAEWQLTQWKVNIFSTLFSSCKLSRSLQSVFAHLPWTCCGCWSSCCYLILLAWLPFRMWKTRIGLLGGCMLFLSTVQTRLWSLSVCLSVRWLLMEHLSVRRPSSMLNLPSLKSDLSSIAVICY